MTMCISRWIRDEILAVVGENGAGKSTLMKILYGLEQPTSGEIYINGELQHFRSPHDAIAKKIGMVQQHFMLLEPCTVAENIVYGREPRKKGLFSTGRPPYISRRSCARSTACTSIRSGW